MRSPQIGEIKSVVFESDLAAASHSHKLCEDARGFRGIKDFVRVGKGEGDQVAGLIFAKQKCSVRTIGRVDQGYARAGGQGDFCSSGR